MPLQPKGYFLQCKDIIHTPLSRFRSSCEGSAQDLTIGIVANVAIEFVVASGAEKARLQREDAAERHRWPGTPPQTQTSPPPPPPPSPSPKTPHSPPTREPGAALCPSHPDLIEHLQERSGTMTRVYYKDASAALVVFDISRWEVIALTLRPAPCTLNPEP